MTAIDVFTITDAMLDDWQAAGIIPQTDLPTAQECALAAHLDVPPTWPKPRPKKPVPTRLCGRCGIDTTLPELCIDCVDVLALERAS